MGTTIYPTVPVEGQGAQLKAEPWPVDEQTIRIDEMFARQLDTAFSSGVRALLYASEAGIAAQSGEGRPPRRQDIDGIVNSEVSGLEVGDPNDPFNLFPQKSVDPDASAVYRPGDQNTTDGLFLPVQAVGDNNRQGRAAELTVLEEIKKLLPEPKTATHIRLYVEGGPRYMVGDIVFSPNGTSLIVLEVKSGMAELTPMQIRALAEAVKSGNIHLTNPAAAKMFGLEVGQTFAEKKILPQVYVIDGNQEAIRRQMIRAGLEVIPEYLGRRRVLRLRARPT